MGRWGLRAIALAAFFAALVPAASAQTAAPSFSQTFPSPISTTSSLKVEAWGDVAVTSGSDLFVLHYSNALKLRVTLIAGPTDPTFADLGWALGGPTPLRNYVELRIPNTSSGRADVSSQTLDRSGVWEQDLTSIVSTSGAMDLALTWTTNLPNEYFASRPYLWAKKEIHLVAAKNASPAIAWENPTFASGTASAKLNVLKLQNSPLTLLSFVTIKDSKGGVVKPTVTTTQAGAFTQSLYSFPAVAGTSYSFEAIDRMGNTTQTTLNVPAARRVGGSSSSVSASIQGATQTGNGPTITLDQTPKTYYNTATTIAAIATPSDSVTWKTSIDGGFSWTDGQNTATFDANRLYRVKFSATRLGQESVLTLDPIVFDNVAPTLDVQPLGVTGWDEATYKEFVNPTSLQWKKVSLGLNFTVALRNDGTVWTWGSNSSRQLGDGGTADRNYPAQITISGTKKALDISAGSDHSLALLEDGTVWAWGLNNGNGQLGVGDAVQSAIPRLVQGLSGYNVSSVAAGGDQSFVVLSDGRLLGWGVNSAGQLSDGTITQRNTPVPVLTAAGQGISNIVQVSAGDDHVLALTADGKVYSWGLYSTNGQLGTGTTTQKFFAQLVSFPNGTAVKVISAGGDHSLALTTNGEVYAWGFNSNGQLGIGSTTTQTTPMKLASFGTTHPKAVAIDVGANHSIALTDNGALYVWGADNNGQLGDNGSSAQTSPKLLSVYGISATSIIGAGGDFAMVSSSQGLSAWGLGTSGQLGNGTFASAKVPNVVVGKQVRNVLAGGGNHSLMLRPDGTVWAWGDNTYGQLGDGTQTQRNIPVQVKEANGVALSNVVSISSGRTHSLAMKKDGTVWAWGDNAYGQLGNNSTTWSLIAVQVKDYLGNFINNAIAISAGSYHNQVIRQDSSGWSWGLNGNGQLGINSTTQSLQAVPIRNGSNTSLTSFIFVAAGESHSLGLKSDQTIVSWGAGGNGQLGNNSLTNSLVPVNVVDTTGTQIGNWGFISCQGQNSFAIKTDGSVWGWGDNYLNQLATTSGPFKSVPFEYYINNSKITNGVSITKCGNAVLVHTRDGSVWFCGQNAASQYGNSTLSKSSMLVQVQALNGTKVSNIISFGSGINICLALNNSGRVYTWGDNYYGQLGINTTNNSHIPKFVNNSNGEKLVKAVGVSSGDQHNLVLIDNGTVFSWGTNHYAELGVNSYSDIPTSVPLQVLDSDGVFLSDIVLVSAGGHRSAALKANGTIYSWGENTVTSLPRATPLKDSLGNVLSGFTSVSCGNGYSAALRNDGTVWTWGNTTGNSANNNPGMLIPVPIKDSLGNIFTNVKAISSGSDHILLIKNDGTAWACGNNSSGQLGNNSLISSFFPVKVKDDTGIDLSNIVAISAGNEFSLALKSDGSVWGWGRNNGTLADGTKVPRSYAKRIVLFSKVVSVSSGGSHATVLTDNGEIWAWGLNAVGQIGLNSNSLESLNPIKIPYFPTSILVSSGKQNTVAVTSNGLLIACGLNSNLCNSPTPIYTQHFLPLTGPNRSYLISTSDSTGLATPPWKFRIKIMTDSTIGEPVWGAWTDGDDNTFPTFDQKARYWLQVKSTDLAGNTTYWPADTGEINPPVDPLYTTGDDIGPQLSTATIPITPQKPSVPFTLTATDKLSGVDGASWNPQLLDANSGDAPIAPGIDWSVNAIDAGTRQVSIAREGRFKLQVSVKDTLGNATNFTSAPFVVDGSAPSIILSGVPTGGTNVPVSISAQISDPAAANGSSGSGIASYQYSVRNVSTDQTISGPVQTVSGAGPFVLNVPQISQTGSYEVTVTASDAAGNVRSVTSAPFTIDTSGPAVSAIVPAFTKSGITMTASASDSSGINTGSWSWSLKNLKTNQTQTGSGPSVTLSAEGSFELSFSVADSFGNVGASPAYALKLDDSAPSIGFQAAYPVLSRNAITLSPQVSDPSAPDGSLGSGIASIGYSYTQPGSGNQVSGSLTLSNLSFSLTGEGVYSDVKISATDNAGNVRTVTLNPIAIDQTPPSLQIAVSSVEQDVNGSFVTASASSSSPDLDGATWTWSLTNTVTNAVQSGTGSSFVLRTSGSYSIAFALKDLAGNSGSGSLSYQAVLSGPVVTSTLSGITYTNADVNLASLFNATSLAPPVSWQYFVNSSSASSIAQEGTYSVYAIASDAGGSTRSQTYTIVVDKTAPVLSWGSGADSNSGQAFKNASFALQVLSSEVGQISASASASASAIASGSGPYAVTIVPANGFSTFDSIVSVGFVDRAGNASNVLTKSVRFDAAAPQIAALHVWDSNGAEVAAADFLYGASAGVTAETIEDSSVSYRVLVRSVQGAPSDEASWGAAAWQTWTATPTNVALPSTTNYLYVQARDAAGNVSPIASRVIRKDTSSPSSATIVSTTHPYANVLTDAVAQKNAILRMKVQTTSPAGIKEFQWKLFAQAGAPDTQSAGIVSGVSDGEVSLNNLPDNANGEYYWFAVRAVGGNAQLGPWSFYKLRVDTSPPAALTVTSSTHPLSDTFYAGPTAIFDWNQPADFTGVKTYWYKLETLSVGQAWTPASVQDSSWSQTSARQLSLNLGASAGQVGIVVCAEDWSGNKQYSSKSILWDNEKPLVGDGSASGLSVVSSAQDSSAVLSWSAVVDNVSSFQTGLRVGTLLQSLNADASRTNLTHWRYSEEANASIEWTGLVAGVTYIAIFAAEDAAGNRVEIPTLFEVGNPNPPAVAYSADFSESWGGFTVSGQSEYLGPIVQSQSARLTVLGTPLQLQNSPSRVDLTNLAPNAPFSAVPESADYTGPLGWAAPPLTLSAGGFSLSRALGLRLNSVQAKLGLVDLQGLELGLSFALVQVGPAPNYALSSGASSFAAAVDFASVETDGVSLQAIPGWTIRGLTSAALSSGGWTSASSARVEASSALTIRTGEAGQAAYRPTVESGALFVGTSLARAALSSSVDWYVHAGGQTVRVPSDAFAEIRGDRLVLSRAYLANAGQSSNATIELNDLHVDLAGRWWAGVNFRSSVTGVLTTSAGELTPSSSTNPFTVVGNALVLSSGQIARTDGSVVSVTNAVLGPEGLVSGSVSGSVTKEYFGFSLQASGATIVGNVLNFASASIDLGPFGRTVALSGLGISLVDDQVVQAGVTGQSLALVTSYGSTGVVANGLRLDASGVHAGLSLTLPDSWGSDASSRVLDLGTRTLSADASVADAAQPIVYAPISYFGFEYTPSAVSFQANGVRMTGLKAQLTSAFDAPELVFEGLTLRSDVGVVQSAVATSRVGARYGNWDLSFEALRVGSSGLEGEPKILLPASLGAGEQVLGTTHLASDGSYTMASVQTQIAVETFGWVSSASGLALEGDQIKLSGVTVLMPGLMQSADVAIGNLFVDRDGEIAETGSSALVSLRGTNGFRVEGTNAHFAPRGLVMGGKVFLPESLGGASIDFADAQIALEGDGAVIASSSNASLNFPFLGFGVRAQIATVDRKGLTISGAKVTPLGLAEIELPDFTVYSTGELAVGGQSLSEGSFPLAGGAQISYSGVRFVDDGLHLSASVTLPPNWGAASLNFDDIWISPDGKISAESSLRDVGFPIESIGLSVHFDALRLSREGFRIDGANFAFVSGELAGKSLAVSSALLDYSGNLDLYGFEFDPIDLWGYKLFLTGLSVSSASVGLSGGIQLPDNLPIPELSGLYISLDKFQVGFDGSVQEFKVHLDEGLSFTIYDSWVLDIEGLAIDKNILSVGQAKLHLPAGFLVSEASVSGLSLNLQTGELTWGSISVAGLNYEWNGITFRLASLTIDQVRGLIFSGEVSIPAAAKDGTPYPEILQNRTLVVTELQFKPDGSVGNVAASVSGITGPLVGNDVMVSNATLGFDNRNGGLIFSFSGGIKLGAAFPPGIAGMVLNIHKLSYNAADASFGELDVGLTDPAGLPPISLFGAMDFTPTTIAMGQTGANTFQFSLAGDFVTSASFPGVLANRRIAVREFRIDSNGNIMALDAGLDLPGENELTGGMNLKDARFAVRYQSVPTKSLKYSISGSVVLGSGFMAGLSGTVMDVRKLVFLGDGSLDDLDIGLSWTGSKDFFGVAQIENGSVNVVGTNANALTIAVGGAFVLPNSLPQGLAGLKLTIGKLIFTSAGEILDIDIASSGLNLSLFGAADLTGGSLRFSRYDAASLRIDLGGVLKLPAAMGAGLGGVSLSLSEFAFTTGGQILAMKGGLGLPATIPLFAGISAEGANFSFDQTGVSVAGTVRIPQTMIKNLPQTIVLQKLAISWQGELLDLAAGIDAWNVEIAGFSTEIRNLVVSKTGIAIASAVMTLPPNLGSKKISIVNAGFDSNGSFTGAVGVSEISQEIAGFTLTISGLGFDIANRKLTVAVARLVTPKLGSLNANVNLNGVTVAPSGVTLGGIGFNLPNFEYGGIGFRAIFLNFSVAADSFLIEGGGQASIPGIGTLDAQLSFTKATEVYPIGLKRAYFEYTVSVGGIPLGTTGLFLNKIRGGFTYGPPIELPADLKPLFDERGPRLQLGVGLYAVDPKLVSMDANFWIDVKNAAWAFEGKATVLSGLATGRLAAGFGNNIFYGTFSFEILFVEGQVRVWIFPYEGRTAFSGDGRLTFKIPRGFILHWEWDLGWFGRGEYNFPDSTWYFGGIYAEFGQFRQGQGVKGWLDLPILGSVGGFVDGGGLHFNISDYQLVKPAGY